MSVAVGRVRHDNLPGLQIKLRSHQRKPFTARATCAIALAIGVGFIVVDPTAGSGPLRLNDSLAEARLAHRQLVLIVDIHKRAPGFSRSLFRVGPGAIALDHCPLSSCVMVHISGWAGF